MTTFVVAQAEIWYSYKRIEANNATEAKLLVEKNQGEEINFEYSHTLDSEYWQVEESEDL